MKVEDKNKCLSKNMKKVTLAIVFLDIINSTKFVQNYGAEKSAIWFQVHDKLARNLIYRFNGREIDRSDGFMLSFENIIDAVQFSLKYQEDTPKKTPFNSRIGIHWAEVIEIQQEDKYTAVGAKRIELEGLGKAKAARCMSICQKKQVLLTKEAFLKLKSSINLNKYFKKETRTALVGLYEFKGVKEPQEIYAVGTKIENLQPPPSGEKVKRIGGSKKIKSRIRDRKIKEWIDWLLYRLTIISLIMTIFVLYNIAIRETSNQIFYDFTGINLNKYFSWINKFILFIIKILEG